MIFVTVGSMLPFDRLIQTMDRWQRLHGDVEVFAQIGAGTYEPAHMKWVRRLSPTAFEETARASELIVAHAGTGTVITASDFGLPVVILPRQRRLREHTTDHQIDTAAWLKGRPGIFVAEADGSDLDARIEEARTVGVTGEMLPRSADPAFLQKIRAAITEP